MKGPVLAGLVIIGIGILLIAGFLLYSFIWSSGIPLPVKIGIMTIILGVLIILIYLVIERIREVRK